MISIAAWSQLKVKPGVWGYLTEKARPITTRKTARIRKGARTCAIQTLTGLLLIVAN
jgi:hypothetical protein